MMKKGLLLSALMAGLAEADEIVLANGTSIRWKSIVQAGDQLDVVSIDGQKLKVKKGDVVRITVDPPGTPLIGATFTKKPLAPVDLLTKINAKRDSLSGNWHLAGGSLRVDLPPGAPAILEVPYSPPEEYDLAVTVERTDGADRLVVGLAAAGKAFGISLGATTGGLYCLDNAGPEANETGKPQKEPLLPRGKARTIVCKVRKTGVGCTVDGTVLVDWQQGFNRITEPGGWIPTAKGKLFLSAAGGFKVTRMIVTPYPDD
jgi:hypothetical protein